MKRRDISEFSDEQLYNLALEKRRNGNGTSRAYAAQRELIKRNGAVEMHSSRSDGSTKRFAYNADYMSFEADNR